MACGCFFLRRAVGLLNNDTGMCMSTFKLIVNGTLLPGHETDEVKARIAKLFKLADRPKQLAALFSGQPVTIKTGLSAAQARTYLNAIEGAGLACQQVAEAEVKPEPESEPQPEPASAPLASSGVAQAAAEAGPFPERTTAATDETDTPPFIGQHAEATPNGSAWTDNPYQQPEAELSIPHEADSLALVTPKKLRGGAGVAWIKEGYGYFKMNPWVWIGMILLGLVVMVGVGAVGGLLAAIFPPLGVVLFIGFYLLTPVFSAGFILACYELYQGEKFGVGALFSGFRNNLGGLLGLGVLYTIAYVIIMGVVMGSMMMLMGSQGNLMMGEGSPLALLLYNLLVMALSIPVMMAIWFAPALVAIHGVSPLKAMGMSLKGCLRNVWPFTLYGLVGFVLAIVATIPFGLGWFVLVPVMTGSIFAGYREIFTEEQGAAPESADLSA